MMQKVRVVSRLWKVWIRPCGEGCMGGGIAKVEEKMFLRIENNIGKRIKAEQKFIFSV